MRWLCAQPPRLKAEFGNAPTTDGRIFCVQKTEHFSGRSMGTIGVIVATSAILTKRI